MGKPNYYVYCSVIGSLIDHKYANYLKADRNITDYYALLVKIWLFSSMENGKPNILIKLAFEAL